jgi:exodeoxyribonuclease VII large subunit
MFKRAASALGFMPRDGEMVELRGKLGVYEARGDLQLVVESMQRAGQGDLFAQFLKLKTALENEGLFSQDRKKRLPSHPRAIGLITSLGAAALHDVVTALQRRVPHIPVILAPASVQGSNAPVELLQSLKNLVAWQAPSNSANHQPMAVDVILIVRGGGSMEDLWSFNDETLVRAVAACPIPVVSGVGHETDFTLLDFVADLRAPTPTAAAELVAVDRSQKVLELETVQQVLTDSVMANLDKMNQRLDWVAGRLGRPSGRISDQNAKLQRIGQTLKFAVRTQVNQHLQGIKTLSLNLPKAFQSNLQSQQRVLSHHQTRLDLLDPHLVLERGYAWLTDESGKALTHAKDFLPAQDVSATLADGQVKLRVR